MPTLGGLVVGKVTTVDLLVTVGVDLTFDVEWWEDELYTVPIPIASVESYVRESFDAPLVLDVGAHATVDSTRTNVVHVAVPAAVTALLDPLSQAVWDLKVVAQGSGEERMLMRGPAQVLAAVTRD